MKRVMASVLFKSVDPFNICDKTDNLLQIKQLREDHILLLHGGADISPSIYKQKTNNFCFANNKPSERDTMEMLFIEQAIKMELPIIGICRGAQLLCAMDGGYLIQHITGHTGGNHLITDTDTGELYKSNSCHHQMMVPNKKHPNIILAGDKRTVMGIKEDGQEIEIKEVPEIVYFPKLRAIGIQGHPEWMPNTRFTEYCASLILKYIL